MDISLWISIGSTVIALAGALTGIFIARSTRHKNEADATSAITEAAMNIVELREKDAKIKQEQIDKLELKVDCLQDYVTYLLEWIKAHMDGEDKPITLAEFNEKCK